MKPSRILIGLFITVLVILGGYWIYQNYLAPPSTELVVVESRPAADSGELVSAEGVVVPASQAALAFTRAGRVAEVLVEAGQTVAVGDPLIRLDAGMLEASLAEARAALEAAQAALQAANTQAAQAQAAVHQGAYSQRITDWSEYLPPAIEQPSWYFDQAQQIASAQAEVDTAWEALQNEQANLDQVLAGLTSTEYLTAEMRLADCQLAFLVASDLLERARNSYEHELQDQAQSLYDIALSRLEAAQADYEQLLDSEEMADLLEARARLTTAQERYDLAMDRLLSLQTGDYSLELQAAQDAVTQAEAGVAQAEAAVQAAQAVLDEATLLAPLNGIVAQVNVEAGEMVSPGAPVVWLADLSAWQVETTDLAENDVVRLEVGMSVSVTLDAFPEQRFAGTIAEIALIGEESRGAVVYTVTVDFAAEGKTLRWGMTAYVDVELGR